MNDGPLAAPGAHGLPAADVLAAVASDPDAGLTTEEARRRLAKYGPNRLVTAPPVPAWRLFLGQFQDVLVVLLLVATVISASLWLYERDSALPYEAIAILAIVLFNAIIGFVQQSRAEAALSALKRMTAARAKVIRDGAPANVPAAELVPGDIVLVEAGDTVPADGRVIESTALHAAEAALTGESIPVSKHTEPLPPDVVLGDRRNMVFSGTSTTYGRGKIVVTATGMQTEMGRIASMLEQAPPERTPLQHELARVGRLLGIAVVAIALVIVATILLVSDVRGFSAFFDVLIFGVALAVAAVPEGLPAIVTAVLALGVQRMAKRNAIVRHLSAVETLGSANVIASDKTGTLTKNEMTVRVVVTASGRVELGGTGYAPEGEVRAAGSPDGRIEEPLRTELERALTAGDRANNAALRQRNGQWEIEGDPTEGALLVAARKAGLAPDRLDARFRRVAEIPFSSERKRMSTVHADEEQGGRLLAFSKGAPDVLLGLCSHELAGGQEVPLDDARRQEILAQNEALAREALRTLGVAYRELPEDALAEGDAGERMEKNLVFAGLVGMIDPPRPEAQEAVRLARTAGVRSLLVTGDHPSTAAVIARELGIGEDSRVVTGAELEKLSDEALADVVREVSVYARVNPEHKLRIVRALQQQDAIVAMTGDGVNDAPALKTADIGVAMGITGTDVSKNAADIVLTDDNFASIVAAVEEGRAIFANIRKFLRYLLSSNVGEVLTMFFGVLLADFIGLAAAGDGVALPLLATQILWINLVTDGAPALALGVDPADPGVMRRPPRARNEGVITNRMWRGIVFVGAIFATGTLLVIDASLPGGLIEGSGDLRYAQTMAFTTIVMFSLFNVFNARSDVQTAFRGLFTNRWLWGSLLLAFVLQLAVVYVPFLQEAFSTSPLSVGDWLVCTAVGSSVLWLRELGKLAARHAGKGRTAVVPGCACL
ncbi:MAG TPA: cation-translocating P-type ATPase [Woeseiaceae bacterium]|nr:cation-translocating P-type ATPase [Woeseiaceae bacterium]